MKAHFFFILNIFFYFIFTMTFLLPIGKHSGVLNPNIGVIMDGVVDFNIYSATDNTNQNHTNYSLGWDLRAFEILFAADIDPHAEFYGNLLFSTTGVEIHEAFVFFPYFLFPGVNGKVGKFFVNFNRLNTTHTHALPFISEPRIYREFFGGSLLSTGTEFSWLLPLPFFLEGTFSIYQNLSADTHDRDPISMSINRAYGIDDFAEQQGLENKHGTGVTAHWHDKESGNVVEYATLVQRAQTLGVVLSDNIPLPIEQINSWRNLVYGIRLQSAIDLGNDLSLDLGANVLYNPYHSYSIQIENNIYSYLVYGSFLTLFYRPLGRNLLNNITLGIEWIGHLKTFESVKDDEIIPERKNKSGILTHFEIQLNRTFKFGFFLDFFPENISSEVWRQHHGVNLTYLISHFQYMRLEYNYYDYPNELEKVHRILWQYNIVVGFHSHENKR